MPAKSEAAIERKRQRRRQRRLEAKAPVPDFILQMSKTSAAYRRRIAERFLNPIKEMSKTRLRLMISDAVRNT